MDLARQPLNAGGSMGMGSDEECAEKGALQQSDRGLVGAEGGLPGGQREEHGGEQEEEKGPRLLVVTVHRVDTQCGDREEVMVTLDKKKR